MVNPPLITWTSSSYPRMKQFTSVNALGMMFAVIVIGKAGYK